MIRRNRTSKLPVGWEVNTAGCREMPERWENGGGWGALGWMGRCKGPL